MLENGELDLMSDVSYKPEREEKMLFPSIPMGSEEYYVFISPNNTEISPTDPTTLEGKRVGVNKNSVEADYFEEWKERTGIHTQTIPVAYTEGESRAMMERGELDAYVTVDAFADPSSAVSVCRVGYSDFYFVVNKDRPDLLQDLESALSRIVEEDRYYDCELFEKYIRQAGANAFLAEQERAWLETHGPVRVGYQDDYLAFCATDPETGELTGVLKDYRASASRRMVNA